MEIFSKVTYIEWEIKTNGNNVENNQIEWAIMCIEREIKTEGNNVESKKY
jgi:hypothetical protein